MDFIWNGKSIGAVETESEDTLEFCNCSFRIEGDSTVALETPSCPPLYKQNKKGQWQKMLFWLEVGDGAILCSAIEMMEGAGSPRMYRTPLKMMNSKAFSTVMQERILSKWTKKKERDGWAVSRDSKDQPLREPMLLHHWDLHQEKMSYPAIIMGKMNGICGVYLEAKDILMSRKRNPFEKLEYIQRELRQLGLDVHGELWNDMMELEDIVSAVKAGRGKVYFYIFEHPCEEDNYAERMAPVIRKINEGNYKYLKVSPMAVVQSAEQVLDSFAILKEMDGMDGAVVHALDCPYEWDSRSYGILKVKDIIHNEYRLSAMVSDQDDKYGSLAKFEFTCDKVGDTFLYVPNKSKEERAQIWERYYYKPEKYIGTLWTLEFREYTKRGLPRHITNCTERNYE